MYLRTKHIALPYHLFWYKSKALKIEVLSINTNDHLADQFAKGLQEGNFELAPKALIKWYLIKGGGSVYWDVYYLSCGSWPIRGYIQVWTHCAIRTYVRQLLTYTLSSSHVVVRPQEHILLIPAPI